MIVLVIASSVLVIYSFTYKYFEKKKPVPCPEYCKNLSEQLTNLNYDQCSYKEALEEHDEYVHFFFRLKNNLSNPQDYDEFINDVVKIKNTISNYLVTNPSNDLNNKYIKCGFSNNKSTLIVMYNYNSTAEQPQKKFTRYEDFYITPKFFKDFTEAKIIGIKIKDDDDLSELTNYTELKKLSIYWENGKNQRILDKLTEMLPNCDVEK